MKKNVIVIITLLFIFLISSARGQAGEGVEISGMLIPVIEGAAEVSAKPREPVKARIATYAVNKPLSEVVDFYSSFFKANNFTLLGGPENESGFNAAVKKGDCQFSIRIYTEEGAARAQFIW